MVGELANWIKDGLKKGYSLYVLKAKALEQGYSEKEIENALKNPEKTKEIKEAKPKKRRIILIALIAVAVLLLIAVFAYVQTSKENLLIPAPSQNLNETCVETQMQLCGALLTDDETWCENAAKKESCGYLYYLGKASRSNATNWCDKLNSTVLEEFCKAFISKDLAFCNKQAEESKRDCSLMFSARENSSLCYELQNNKGQCLVLTTQNRDNCKYFTEKC